MEKKETVTITFEDYMRMKGFSKVIFSSPKEIDLDSNLLNKKESFKIVNGERILVDNN